MHIYLFDRGDRLGSNITNYIAQILYAYKHCYIIKFMKKKSEYKYYNSIFVKTLFDYIDKHNEELYKINIQDENIVRFEDEEDWIFVTSFTLQKLKTDLITYFHRNIYNTIQDNFTNLSFKYNIPFDINKTILVHLRLDDVVNNRFNYHNDYDGSICSEYYKRKISNNKTCKVEFYHRINNQAPLSKDKIDTIINKAKKEFPGYKVLLLTSPISDTSFLDYDFIKSKDESFDLFLLTMCNVTILSRSTYALSSVFFNKNKVKTYIPLWGHFVCTGLNTIYDKNDKNKIEYFY